MFHMKLMGYLNLTVVQAMAGTKRDLFYTRLTMNYVHVRIAQLVEELF